MALFAKSKRDIDPVEEAERALADTCAARGKLADRLSAAQAAVAEKRGGAEQAALAGAADEILDRAEGEVRAAADREQTLRAAMAKAEDQMAGAERALADAVEQRDRNMVADGLEALAAAIAKTYPRYNEVGFELAQVLTEAQTAIGEGAGLAQFLHNTRTEMASACRLLDGALRTRAVAVRAGTMNYTIHRQQVAAPPQSTEPKIATERVLSLEFLKWRVGEEIHVCPQFSQIDLPISLLPLALSLQYVDRFDSARARALIATHGQTYVSPPLDDGRLIDLDALNTTNPSDQAA